MGTDLPEGSSDRTLVAERRIAAVRTFGRYWARTVVPRMEAGPVGSPYSTAEATVIFDLAHSGRLDLTRLRGLVGVDAGHLARIVRRFRNEGLIVTAPPPTAATERGSSVELTDRGLAMFGVLERQSVERTRELLGGLREEQQREVVVAMATIRRALSASMRPTPFTLRGLRPGDLGWVVERHGSIYAEEFGCDERFEGGVARTVAAFAERRDPARERAWIVEVEGVAVGSAFCTSASEDPAEEAELRLLLVEPSARGLGVGRRLVQECVAFARRAGYLRVGAEVENGCVSALRILRAAGFTERAGTAGTRTSAGAAPGGGTGRRWTLTLAYPGPATTGG